MMDCDDVCSTQIDLNILKKYLDPRYETEWDAISFNREPYYDIWALSIGNLAFSHLHFKNGYIAWKTYIDAVMRYAKKNNMLIPCYSAFNGFAIYRIKKFINCEYDGHERLDLIPANLLKENIKLLGSMTICQLANHEGSDCEHRAFHYSAIAKIGAKIRITPDILFDKKN